MFLPILFVDLYHRAQQISDGIRPRCGQYPFEMEAGVFDPGGRKQHQQRHAQRGQDRLQQGSLLPSASVSFLAAMPASSAETGTI